MYSVVTPSKTTVKDSRNTASHIASHVVTEHCGFIQNTHTFAGMPAETRKNREIISSFFSRTDSPEGSLGELFSFTVEKNHKIDKTGTDIPAEKKCSGGLVPVFVCGCAEGIVLCFECGDCSIERVRRSDRCGEGAFCALHQRSGGEIKWHFFVSWRKGLGDSSVSGVISLSLIRILEV